MSDAVMVPRADPDAIWLEPSCCADPSHGRTWSEDLCFPVCEDGREPVKYIRADLAASTPVGGWERTDIQRMMDPVRAYLVDKYVRQPVAEEASERAVDVMYRALAAPPPPSVSTGSRPQEAVPTEFADAFIAGFRASGEGWNGEHPFEDVPDADARFEPVLKAAKAFASKRAVHEVWKVPCDHCHRMTRVPAAPDAVSTASQPGTERSGVDQTILPQTEKGS